jgi:hypothetical protein
MENKAPTMSEWVERDFYEGLLLMPLWVKCAFGYLQDVEDVNVLSKDDWQTILIQGLVIQSIERCPARLHDYRYCNTWKIETFVKIVRAVVKSICKK